MSARCLAVVVLLACTECTNDVTVFEDAPSAPAASPSRQQTLASHYWHTCALSGGVTWCWGRNDHSALGTVTGTSSSTPLRLDTSLVFRALSLGEDFGCGLDASGAAACWGSSIHGQLGQGDTTDSASPVAVPMVSGIVQLSAGANHVCAIDATSALWCWGYNQENGVGIGGAPGQGLDVLAPARVGTGNDWTYVSAGEGHTCGIRAGALYCWGRNSEGECGQGDGAPAQVTTPARVGSRDDWISVSAGQFGACAIDQALSVSCWGQNTYMTLDNPAASLSAPTAVALATSTLDIQINAFTTWARSTAGALSCWGLNQFGELGLGDTSPRALPASTFSESSFSEVALGLQHTCARQIDGSVWCVGRSLEGQLGNGSVTSSSSWVAVSLP